MMPKSQLVLLSWLDGGRTDPSRGTQKKRARIENIKLQADLAHERGGGWVGPNAVRGDKGGGANE
jgi:hypothetical protein